MFNTDAFQTEEDFSYSIKEPVKANTNRRYKFFRQRHFTAGDVEQFLTFWDTTNPGREANFTMQTTHPNCALLLYHRISAVDIFNTFKYMFHKFKKGIFFKVVNGKPKVFLPFSKIDYQNEWYRSIKINPKFKTIQEMMSYIADLDGRIFQESRIHKITKSWYGNNGLVRLEYPISENDSGVNMLRDMFVALVRERGLPSCEVFINKRDFPVLKKNGTEAYDNFFGKNQKLRSHAYKKFAPILSMTTGDDYADIPIPTWEDWCRVSYYHDKRLFGKEYRSYPTQEEFDAVVWSDKKATAVFRGASTGLGTTVDSNPRLFFANLSSHKKIDPEDGLPFLDAGITKWNLRPRMSGGFLDTIHIRELSFGLVEKLTPLEQAGYKYILHLPGHSMAYRLSLELMTGSVLLMYPCGWKLWYSDMLKPYIHYVPLDPENPNDIYIKIKWCKKNDEKCRIIAANARAFAIKHLNRDAILDYLTNVLRNLAKNTGRIHHPEYDIQKLIHDRELSLLHKNLWSHPHKIYQESFNKLIETGSCGSISRALFQLFMTAHHNKKSDSSDKIKVVYVGGRKVVQKRLKGDLHEPTIGYMIINAIAEEIPNFIYTFYHDESFVYLEHVDGKTFEELLLDPGTTLEDIIEIYKLICLGIRHAQLVCGFMHMDLYPWNIIIKRFDEPVVVRYNVFGNEYVEVKTKVMPVFIDYGRSHVVYEAQHFYNVSPFRICSIQDVVSVVFSSMHIFLKKNRIDEKQISTVFRVMRFFSQTSYMSEANLRNVSTLKMFLSEKKKFSNMLYDPKNGLDHFNPMDFYRHLHGVYHTFRQENSNRIASFVMCPHLYNPIVCQIKFMEVFDLVDLDMDKDLYIKNVIINLRNEAEMDEDVRAWCTNMLGCETAGVFYEKFSIRMPHSDSVAKIPLFSSHPFVEHQVQKIETHYDRKDWLVVFKMMIHNRIREDAFHVFTRCFRNFWFMNLKK